MGDARAGSASDAETPVAGRDLLPPIEVSCKSGFALTAE